MKKLINSQRLAILVALLITVLPLLSFKAGTNAQTTTVVGIAYGSMKCGNLTVQTVKGYEYATSQTLSVKDMISAVKSNTANKYGIEEKNVVIKTGYTSHAVIIEYKKAVSGWNCSKTLYAVGFGNSFGEAEQHASKIRETKEGSHTVLRQITSS